MIGSQVTNGNHDNSHGNHINNHGNHASNNNNNQIKQQGRVSRIPVRIQQKATTPRSTRPPSPRQRPVSPAASKGRTPSGDRTDGAGKRTPGRSPSPRTHGRQTDGGDAKKTKTPGKLSELKKILGL